MHELTPHTSFFCVKNVDQIYPRMYLLKKTALGHLSIMHDSSTYVVRTMSSLMSVLHFLFSFPNQNPPTTHHQRISQNIPIVFSKNFQISNSPTIHHQRIAKEFR